MKRPSGVLTSMFSAPAAMAFAAAWIVATVPQALPAPWTCSMKKRPCSACARSRQPAGSAFFAASASARAALSFSRRGLAIFSMGKRRQRARHGRGIIMRSSGSRPNTSEKPHSAGTPRRQTNGLSTSGFDSSGSHAGMVVRSSSGVRFSGGPRLSSSTSSMSLIFRRLDCINSATARAIRLRGRRCGVAAAVGATRERAARVARVRHECDECGGVFAAKL
mmetsp:Transcript_36648/g.113415  ORF Transcript_36648/g.113415 Transcript_36648/m.113415 type:complete len:221 (-) Transcript_36648:2655-3317(-)